MNRRFFLFSALAAVAAAAGSPACAAQVNARTRPQTVWFLREGSLRGLFLNSLQHGRTARFDDAEYLAG